MVRTRLHASRWTAAVTLGSALTAFAVGALSRRAAAAPADNGLSFVNDSGILRTLSTAGAIDIQNPFFEDLGSNGRRCVSCHRPAQAWTVTPAELRQRFATTSGLDPVFRTNDGSVCEGADVSTKAARRSAYALLLDKGLFRIELDVPAAAEFEIVDVDDPYKCGALFTTVSAYRRPLPTANLRFLSAVMWDGRQTAPGRSIREDLIDQAADAVIKHAQGPAPSLGQLREIVDFELGIFAAQARHHGAGTLTEPVADGGPAALSRQPFCIGINDPLGMRPNVPGACSAPSPFDPTVFTLFDRWAGTGSPERSAIARGQAIFNTRTFTIANVPGLNGGPQDPVGAPIAKGTCTVCHDTPNAGNHSVAMALNIGTADPARRTPDLPLYTLRHKATAELTQTSDPGRALITGRWADVGKFKGPVLRALSARAPYFHNGSAATLEEVIEFYESRFQIGLSPQERADLIAFLSAL